MIHCSVRLPAVGAAACISLVLAFIATGATPPPRPAHSKGDQVNVRSRPGLGGEVLTRLKKDQAVVVLGTVKLKQPATNEPPVWFRILVPEGTPAWVAAEYVNPTNHIITADVLQVRGGPSYDHGTIARIKRGTSVTPHGEPKSGWLQIVAPPDAQGYVPAMYVVIDSEEAGPKPHTPEAPKPSTAPAPAPVSQTNPPSASTPAPAPLVKPSSASAPAPAPLKNPPSASTPAPAPLDTASAIAESEPVIEPAKPLFPAGLNDPSARRASREGKVVRMINPQSPSNFALEALDSGRIMNFLVTTRPEPLDFREYRGKVVLVAGREYLDRRPLWSEIPLLNVETIEAVH